MWWLLILIVVGVILAVILTIIFIYSQKSEKYVDRDQEEIEQFGKVGENYVAKYLQGIAKTYNGYLYNDYCFEDDKGYSTEIDHILITSGGLFIIETKTHKGTIFGEIDNPKWVCVKKSYQDDKELKNPIIQNQGHINHLKIMFKGNPPKMESIIIFVIADISNVKYDNVYNLPSAMTYIADKSASNRYPPTYIESVNKRLIKIKEKYGISKQKHIENIKRKYHQ